MLDTSASPLSENTNPNENKYTCAQCGSEFRKKSELMHHKKKHHPTNTFECKNFIIGNCRRSHNNGADCWYRHSQLQTPRTVQNRAGPNYASTTTAKTKPTNGAHDESVDQVDEIENPNNPNWVSKSKYRKQINKHKIKLLTAIFNYSSIVLTDDMKELLNMGLNFAILPLKLDITQVLVDFKKYERSLVWKEFWFGKEQDEIYSPLIFKES